MRSLSVIYATCMLFLALHSSKGASNDPWTYAGEHGVTAWTKDFPGQCDGDSQSPIDIPGTVIRLNASFSLDPFVFSGFSAVSGVTWTLTIAGHAVKVIVGGNAPMTVAGGSLGGTYQVVQFHFHWGSDNTKGSEHTVDGSAFPLEMHVVTYNTKYANLSDSLSHSDGLAVLGYFVEVSDTANTNMDTIVNALATLTPSQKSSVTPVPLVDMVTTKTDYYRYSGSLTTPTCNEVVTWTVFKVPIKMSNAQLQAFRVLQDTNNESLSNNYRPVQPLNSRMIYSSFVFTASSSHVASSSVMSVCCVLLLSLGFSP